MLRIGIASLAATILSLSVIGCGGGASEKPKITAKPSQGSEEASGAAAEVETESAAPAAVAEGIGGLKGRIVLTGGEKSLPPLVEKGDMAVKDAAVCAAETIADQSIVTGENGGLANVFVYLERAPKGADIPAASADPVVFDQKGCVFIPHVLSVRAGQTIKVISDDAIAHNTHTFPVRNVSFNTVISPNDRDGVPLVYEQPEKIPVQVKCDIHPWMVAYHMPLDHPFVAVTAADGTFEIKDLPSGEHTFRVWHEKAGYLDRAYKVVVKPDTTVEVELSYGADALAKFEGNRPKVIQLTSSR